MKRFDLAVVGGGILGTFHALAALEKGLSVILLEKNSRPVHASVRNFGQIVPSGMAGRWFDFGVRSMEVYRGIQSRRDIGISQNGSVYVASDPDEQQLLHELYKVMTDRQYPCRLMSARECLKTWSGLSAAYCTEGLFFPEELSAEPAFTLEAIQQFMRETQSNFSHFTKTAVIRVEEQSEFVELTAASGQTFQAGHVIVCNGGEFRILFPELWSESGIQVCKLQMLSTIPLRTLNLKGNILTGLTIRRYESFSCLPSFSLISTPQALEHLKEEGIHILFKQGRDGSVIIGDSHHYASADSAEDLGFDISEHVNQLILSEARRILPIDGLDIARTWVGYYPQHKERDVFELTISPRVHIRTAIGGKGMTSSAGYAEHSVAEILSQSIK